MKNREGAFIEKVATNYDNNLFAEDDLVVLSVPMRLPYFTDLPEEKVKGIIEIDGKSLQYVKRKIENNILYVWCVRNHAVESIKKLSDNITLTVTTDKFPTQHGKVKLVKLMQTEYLSFTQKFGAPRRSLKICENNFYLADSHFISLPDPSVIPQPPEVFC